MSRSSAGPTKYGASAGRHVFWAVSGQFALVLLGFGWLFLIPRMMGAVCYGNFIVATALVSTTVNTGGLGVTFIFGHYVPKLQAQGQRRHVRRLFTGVGAARSVLGLGLGVLAGWLAVKLVPGELSTVSAVAIGAAIFVSMVATNFAALIYGRNEIGKWAAILPAHQAARLALVAGLFVVYGLGGGILALALAQVLFAALAMVLSYPWPLGRLSEIEAGETYTYIKFGFLAAFGAFIYVTLARVGNIAMAAIAVPPSTIAWFGVACSLCVQVGELFGAIPRALVPGLSELTAKGEDARGRRWVRLIARYQTMIAVVAFAALTLNGEEAFIGLLGEEYVGAWPAVVVALSALPFLALLNLGKQVAAAWGHAALNIEFWALLTGLFVPLVLAGSRLYGAIGASGALALSSAGAALYVSVRMSRGVGIRLLDVRTALALIGGLPCVLLLHLRGSVLQGLVFSLGFFAAYGAILHITGAVSLAEIAEARRLLLRSSK